MKSLLVFLLVLQFYLTAAHGGHNVPTPVQLCQVNDGRKTDMCLALTSHTNTSTNSKDLQLHLSVRFYEERTGWAAFGIGEKMHTGLMFVMYPGAKEGGKFPRLHDSTLVNSSDILCRCHGQRSINHVREQY
jgi:hypothetical protein